MNQIEQLTNNYIITHKGSWLGIHDTHNIGIAEKIENVGLCVSYNPYGGKIRRFKDENGNIDLTDNFMSTMYFVKDNKLDIAFDYCVEYVFVDIPKEVLKELNLSNTDEKSYRSVCGYGFQKLIEEKDEDGNLRYKRGDIEPRPTAKNANIRLLPPCFIAGHINSKDKTFVENQKHFSKLTEHQKKLIINDLKSKIKTPPQPGEE